MHFKKLNFTILIELTKACTVKYTILWT